MCACCSRALAAYFDTAANHVSVACRVRARPPEQLVTPRELAHNPQPCHEPPPLRSPIRSHVRVLLECCSRALAARAGTAFGRDGGTYHIRARPPEQLVTPRELAHNLQPCHEPPPLCSPIRLHVLLATRRHYQQTCPLPKGGERARANARLQARTSRRRAHQRATTQRTTQPASQAPRAELRNRSAGMLTGGRRNRGGRCPCSETS